MEPDEKFKIGYDGALKMVAMEASVIWSAFNSALTANAFLITLSGAALKFFPQIKYGTAAIGVAGIFLCAAWFFTMKRQFAYFAYWIAWARSVEKRRLAPEIEMLGRGRQYSEGAGVEVPGLDGTLRAPWSARVFKVQWMATLIIAIFATIYGAIVWLSITS